MTANSLKIMSPTGDTIALGQKTKDRSKGNLWQVLCEAIKSPSHVCSRNKTYKTETVLTKLTGRTWLEWHKALGHIGAKALQNIKSMGIVNGMEVSEGNEGLEFECESCIKAKMHTKPFPKESHTEVKDVGELVVTDVWGPARIASIGRYLYYVSFTDVATRFSTVSFIKHKDETLNEYKNFEAFLNTQRNAKVRRVRFDNGGEFVNSAWKEHTAAKGTVLETTAPYSSQQNGIAERLNRTLLERARAMMFEANAPQFLWNEAVAYACYLKNRSPTQVKGVIQATPFQQFWGKLPDVSLLRPWGAKCYVLDQAEKRSKLDPKAFQAIFTGISDTQGKSWRYYKPGAMRILHSRNVAFLCQDDAPSGENEDEVLVPIAPPAEGEIVPENSSSSEQLKKPKGTGGDSQDIKAEQKVKLESPTAHSSPVPIDTTSTAPSTLSTLLVPPSTTRSSSSRSSKSSTTSRTSSRTSTKASSTKSGPTRALSNMKPATRIQTRSGSAGSPSLRIESDRGPIKISVLDDKGNKPIAEISGSELTKMENAESANICVDNEPDSNLGDEPTPDPPALARLVPSDEIAEHQSIQAAIATAKAIEYEFAHALYEGIMHQSMLNRSGTDDDHPSYDQAMNGPERDKWERAMQEEMAQLERMGTFEIVERPTEVNLIKNGWVFERKRDEYGQIARYKARLVAKGYSQIPGQDFYHSFAPIVHLDSLRILCSLANWFDLDMRQLDVVSAFLNGHLEEELYMEPIAGFDDGSGRVLRLRRSLYGLRQAGYVWNKTFNEILIKLGYTRLLTDSCVYKRVIESPTGPLISFLAVHVDDCVLFTSPNHTRDAVNELLRAFDMRDLGELRHFIGIQFIRDRASRSLTLSQSAYVDLIVEEAGLLDAYPADTPASTTTQLTRHEGVRPNFPYARTIGRLMYAAICTRPDIAFAVNWLAAFTSCYGQAHVTALKRVIRYLAGTSTHGVTYHRDPNQDILDFGETGYSDADWGTSHLDRKSISGNCFLLGGAAISWSSRKQPTVALSTMEAEYMALTHASTQALWIRQFFDELGLGASAPTVISSDNLAALTLSVESQYRGRSKHIDIRHHFIRDCVEKRILSPLYVNTKDNLANALTKPLPAIQFFTLVDQIMGNEGDDLATVMEVEEVE
ncbi:Retrovirus-related Pol polyprotein from transposon TNT 1-94 [Ceratobasidium sp. AG-Ba]|nr:Retrovirus-related Pol polyprotein from transposon TNT 1-94 [Ceratobasidium sp. AG-Ba]